MLDCTVIIPLVKLDNDNLKKLAKTAYNSAPNKMNVILVGNDEALSSFDCQGSNITRLINNGDQSYQNQVNLAVEKVKTKYFTVLEFDDELSELWFDNAEKYSNVNTDELFGMFPLTELVDYATNTTIGYANEAFLASSFSEKIGYFDMDSLTEYLGFNTSGAIFLTKEFIELGKLKPSMKLTFWHEFLMRALYKECVIRVIPKVGCFHTVNRPNCMTDIYSKTMDNTEIDWWIDIAKKEFYFKNDRNKTYKE